MSLARTACRSRCLRNTKCCHQSQTWNKAPRSKLITISHKIRKMSGETVPKTTVNPVMARMKCGTECPSEAFVKGTVMKTIQPQVPKLRYWLLRSDKAESDLARQQRWSLLYRVQPRIFLTLTVVLQLCDELRVVLSKRELSLKSRQTSQGAKKGEHLGSPST